MYRVEVKKTAQKELLQIPPIFSKKIIDGLVINLRPEGSKKLKGSEAYKIRAADYRIVYTIEDSIQLIEVQRIRHRKDVYWD